MKHAHFAAIGLVTTLAACGGGGSTVPPPNPVNGVPVTAPTASAPSVAAPTPSPAAPAPAPATAPPATPAPQSVLNTATLNGSAGFVNPSGLTVYVFDADLPLNGASSCSGACAVLWPPLPPPAGATIASPWGTTTRSDGTTQLSYAGRPLYLYAGDSAAGQTNGDGLNSFGGLWHIARPQSVTSSPTSAPATTPPVSGYSVRRHN
jgi:predicted lipoprotein with Yx(FWY)xxD motif